MTKCVKGSLLSEKLKVSSVTIKVCGLFAFLVARLLLQMYNGVGLALCKVNGLGGF